MPEPDFDQIARATIDEPSWGEDYDREPMVTRVVEQLRQVWNSRGAADCVVVRAELERKELPLMRAALAAKRSVGGRKTGPLKRGR